MKLARLTCGAAHRLPDGKLADNPRCGVCGAPLIDGAVSEIDLATLDKALRHDEAALIVDFWAP